MGCLQLTYEPTLQVVSRTSKNDALARGSKCADVYLYKYNGKEFQDELGVNVYDYGARNYDPALGRWMNIDPLSEKYAYQSHYNFSENRVVDGRELEGLEVVLINPTKSASSAQQKAADKRIADGASKIYSSNTLITVTGHGNPKGITNDVRGQKINNASQLNAVLNRNSDDWKDKKSGDGMTVVLYSCRTGCDVKDKDGNILDQSFAQKISASDEFKDVEVIAPDERVYISEDGVLGAYKAENAGPDGEYKRDSNGDVKSKERSDTPGNWKVFKNGELIRSYQGNWSPTNNPSWWDILTKEN